jgi:hypothetical protein
LAALRRLLADLDLTDARQALLHFGLAEILDARGEYPTAAEHLRLANALTEAGWHTRGQGYDPAAHTAFVDRLLATFTPAFFERVRGFGVDTERPVFIVGLPRSGTTLTEQVLAGHSEVHGAGELPLGRETFAALGEGSSEEDRGQRTEDREQTDLSSVLCPLSSSDEAEAFERLPRLDAATIRHLAERHLGRLRALNGSAPHVVDKMPDNYLYLGLLAVLFPQAKFVHCRRDLRDVAVSCWMTNFRHIRWAADPEHIAARFADYRRLMEYWRRVLPVPLLEVDYEETVADLEGVARRLVAWCGLGWEPACLAFHEGRRPVRTASVAQVRQPIYTRSVGRWKHYQAVLAGLFARLPGGTGSREPSVAEAGPEGPAYRGKPGEPGCQGGRLPQPGSPGFLR